MRCLSVVSYNERLTPNGWHFPHITRPFSIIYYVLSGSAYYEIDGVEYPFKKGYLYIFPVNREYSLREDESDKLNHLYIHAYTFPEISRVMEISVEDDRFLHDALAMLRGYVKNTNRIYVRSLTDMLLAYVFEKRKEIDNSLSSQIKQYVDEHYIDVYHNATMLSDHFNYSETHLVRLFKQRYEITPRQYAQQLMLQESLSFLYKGMSVADIARRLAFSSPENFSRFFKAAYGCAPRAYMRKYSHFPL